MKKESPGVLPNERIPLGSAEYYAIRFAPKEQHARLALINSLYRTLRAIPRECSEPQLARQKLDWWRVEIDRAFEGKAQHPITQQLVEQWQDWPQAGPALERLLNGVQMESKGAPPGTRQEFINHCQDTGGALAQLIARQFGANSMQLECSAILGQFVRQVEIIQELGREVRSGRCLLSREFLDEHGLRTGDLLRPEREKILSQALGELASDAIGEARQALDRLPGQPHPALGTPYSLASISGQLLKVLEQEDYQVMRQYTRLTPMRYFWIAWRSQRAVKRPRILDLPRVR